MKLKKSIILVLAFLLVNNLFAQNKPFPQNQSWPEALKPNHKSEVELSVLVTNLYEMWKTDFLKPTIMEGGYYVEGDCTGCSVESKGTSEGHGYGMIITALMSGYDPDAKQYFDGLYNFFDNYRSVTNNELMNWNVAKDEREPWTGSATDGDFDIAYALLLAHYQWGSDGDINYLEEAVDMINLGLKVGDMSTESKRVMLGDWDNNINTTRPSDWMTGHFRAFADATGDSFWLEAADTVYSIMDNIITNYSPNTGLMPDFIVGESPEPAQPGFLEGPNDGSYYYNACRYPWRIATDYLHFGNNNSKELLSRFLEWSNSNINGDFNNFTAGYQLDGTALTDYNDLVFTSPLVLALTTDTTYQSILNLGWDYIEENYWAYFDGSINMLCQLLITGNWWVPVQNTDGSNAPDIAFEMPAHNSDFYIGDVVEFTFSGNDINKIDNIVYSVNGNEYPPITEAPYVFNYEIANEGEYLVKAVIETTDGTFRILKNVIKGKLLKEDEIGGKIVGYYPTWAGNVSDIQMDKLTHINYSFLIPNTDGTLKPIENVAKLEQLVSDAHLNNVKVSIAIGGWNDGDDSAFETIGADSSLTATFVSNVMDFIRENNLDGVDMDWEYPESGASASNFVSMMTVFADSIHANNMLLTAAVIGKEWDTNSIQDSIFSLVDWLNIMAYDNYSADNHSTYDFAESCLDYWQNTRGLPEEKTVLGVPFYGYSPYSSYSSIVNQYPEAPGTDNVGDYYYNGKNTMNKKTLMAKDRCAGTMIWEISQDTYEQNTSLLTVIYQTYMGDYVGVQKVEKLDFILYPNPATNSLFVNLPQDVKAETVSIIDRSGRLIKSVDLEDFLSTVFIDLKNIESGIYFIEVRNKNAYGVEKFIKL